MRTWLLRLAGAVVLAAAAVLLVLAFTAASAEAPADTAGPAFDA